MPFKIRQTLLCPRLISDAMPFKPPYVVYGLSNSLVQLGAISRRLNGMFSHRDPLFYSSSGFSSKRTLNFRIQWTVLDINIVLSIAANPPHMHISTLTIPAGAVLSHGNIFFGPRSRHSQRR